MKRIFLTLAIFSNIVLAAAFALGVRIDDPKLASSVSDVSWHFLTALGALVFASLVHAIVLTYFMGTGRWMEETTAAYRLDERWQRGCQSLKYKTIPGMITCLTLLILTGALGGAADPAAPSGFGELWGVPASTFHFALAATTLLANLLVNVYEYQALRTNGRFVEEVLAEVRRIRQERGLPV